MKDYIDAAIDTFSNAHEKIEWVAHVVLQDYNLEDDFIDWTLNELMVDQEYLNRFRKDFFSEEYFQEELNVLREFLLWLKTTPEEDRIIYVDDLFGT